MGSEMKKMKEMSLPVQIRVDAGAFLQGCVDPFASKLVDTVNLRE